MHCLTHLTIVRHNATTLLEHGSDRDVDNGIDRTGSVTLNSYLFCNVLLNAKVRAGKTGHAGQIDQAIK
jgi:hypothetical protein